MSYPKWKFRPLLDGEVGDNGEPYKSRIVHSYQQDEALGEEYVENLKEIPAMFEKYHQQESFQPEVVEGAEVEAAPITVEQLEERISELSEEQIRSILVEKHGYSAKKLAKKNKDQLLAIYSS